MGTFYYLANDPKVPSAIRANYRKYGLCKDEFVDFGHIPPQLYIRISNRLVGEYVMTQNNICEPKEAQSVAIGDWSFDEHMTGKYAVPDGKGGYTVTLEGNFWPSVAEACTNPASPYVSAVTVPDNWCKLTFKQAHRSGMIGPRNEIQKERVQRSIQCHCTEAWNWIEPAGASMSLCISCGLLKHTD